MSRGAGALVVGYRKDDARRSTAARALESRARGRFITTPSGLTVPAGGTVRMRAEDLNCTIVGGKCISCNADVYLNRLGYSAVLERDADVCCMQCEDRYGAEITRSL